MFSKFLRQQKQHHYIQEGDSIVVAFSGGADSVFLVEMLLELQKRISFQLLLAHFHHGLRGEYADRDAKFCEDYARQRGLRCIVEKGDVFAYAKREKKSIEEAARELRYAFLEELKEKYGATKIATGHHLDDHLETFFFRLLRGSSLEALAGISRKTKDRIRPLRDFEKEEVVKELQRRALPYCIDETNQDLRYARNKIRKQLLPQLEDYNPKWKEKVLSIMEDLENYKTESPWEDYLVDGALDLLLLTKRAKSEQKKIIYEYFLFKGFVANRKQIDTIQTFLSKGGSLSYDLKAPWICKKSYDRLYLEQKDAPKEKRKEEKEERQKEVEISIPGRTSFQSYEIYASFIEKPEGAVCLELEWKAGEKIVARPYQAGDRILLPGMKSSKKVKEIFINMKIPKEERGELPILVYQDKILALGNLRQSVYQLCYGGRFLHLDCKKVKS